MTSRKKLRKQRQLDELFLDLTDRVSKMSYAKRAQVGALVVKGANIISMGWNGMPRGFKNKCELSPDKSDPLVLHAESNAISKLARDGGNGAKGGTLYCTYSPCVECAKLIIQAGIKRVVYRDEYRVLDALKSLKRVRIQLQQIRRPHVQVNRSIRSTALPTDGDNL